MKKLIFCLVVLFASAGIANAQLNGIYNGTATDLVMGGPVSGIYSCTTTFSSDAMTGMIMSVSGHSVKISDPATFTDNGDTYTWNDDGDGTVITPYGTYDFEVTGITIEFNSFGKLTYDFQAVVTDLGMDIFFTFTES